MPREKTFTVTFTEIVTRKVRVKAQTEDEAVNNATFNEKVIDEQTISEEQEIKVKETNKSRFSLKYLALNHYNHCDEEVDENHIYGFWRIVEQTGAGWFPWPGLYKDKKQAEIILKAVRERHD